MKNILLSISTANNHLLNEPKIADALNACISTIGAMQNIDRCYIFRNNVHDGVLKLYYDYEWCNEGVLPYLNSPNLSGISYSDLSGLYQVLSKDEPVFGLVKNIDDLYFRETMEMQNIKSFLFTPIFSNNSFWGWIGYDDCKSERIWIEEEVHALHTIAKNIGLRLKEDDTTQKLKFALEKIDNYMAVSLQAMWELDLKSKTAVISHNWAGMLGYTDGDILNPHDFWKKSLHPDDAEQVLKDLNNYISGIINHYEGVIRLRHKDGRYLTVKYIGVLLKDQNGTPKKIIGTHLDISELKEREYQLKLSEEKFRFIAENSKDLICQHRNDGSFVYCTSSSYEILGYRPEELLNKNPRDFIYEKDLAHMQNYYDTIMKNQQNGVIAFRARNKKGNYIWLETSTKVIIDANYAVVGFQTSSRDISERIKSEKIKTILFKKEKKFHELKSKLVSMASHQFRTPLTVIYSNAELLDLKMQHLDQAMRDNYKVITLRITNEVDRMTQLMDNILIFGKVDSNIIDKKIQPVDLNNFLQTLIETYFASDKYDRKIIVNTKGISKVFYTDETLLLHIITNLLTNAFKYSEGKADPLLLVRYLENEIEIEIIDYGIGIPAPEVQYLFSSFFRASNTSTIIGSGLGLALVKQFTEFLNGSICVKTKEHYGTTMKLIFPYGQQ